MNRYTGEELKMDENQGIPVLISLSALASYDGTPDDPIRMRTSGTLFPGADRSLLQYKEIQEDQETARILEADIQLVLRKDQVTMNRIGDYSNTMLFKKNIRYETLYHTPYGDLNMSVFTKEARWRSAGGSGSVHLRYDLSMQGSYASTNELRLEYREKEAGAE